MIEQRKLRQYVFKYLYWCGVVAHVVVVILFVVNPQIIHKASSYISSLYYQQQYVKAVETIKQDTSLSPEQEIPLIFEPWRPNNAFTAFIGVRVNEMEFDTLQKAVSALQDGDHLKIGQGIYTTPIKIINNNITITGYGHVVFKDNAVDGKAFIVNKGSNLTVQNIECHNIEVPSQNGACIRQEGSGTLTVEDVYFHSSEEGILETSEQQGNVVIRSSRFEALGKNGQAHGIYINKARIYIENSLFIATKNEGHAIKSRGDSTVITNSFIVSLSSNDSRSIDIPNGGKLELTNSLIEQGPLSVNKEIIGYGHEGLRYTENKVVMNNNMLILDRVGGNSVLAFGSDKPLSLIKDNIIIGIDRSFQRQDSNILIDSREIAGIGKYPYLPISFCENLAYCPLVKH